MGSARNMLWSTLALMGMVLAFYALVARPDKVDRQAVDITGSISEARRATGLALGELRGLDGGFAPTVARLEPSVGGLQTWQVRYVDDPRYVAVSQAAKVTPDWVTALVKKREPAGTVTVGGVPVETFTSGGACTLLRRGGEGLSTVVETGESCAQAVRYAERLTPALR